MSPGNSSDDEPRMFLDEGPSFAEEWDDDDNNNDHGMSHSDTSRGEGSPCHPIGVYAVSLIQLIKFLVYVRLQEKKYI